MTNFKEELYKHNQVDIGNRDIMSEPPVVMVSKPTLDELIAKNEELIKENQQFMELVTKREYELQAVIWERDSAWETIEEQKAILDIQAKEINHLKMKELMKDRGIQ